MVMEDSFVAGFVVQGQALEPPSVLHFSFACFSFFISAKDARWPERKMKNMQ
jgi:fructose-1-phosphate kinase PfkB-like protein